MLTSTSGLGFAICCRLIDEFILTRPKSHSLRLIFTTRNRAKSNDTITRLRDHIFRTRKQHKKHQQTPLVAKIYLQAELVDLNQLRSTQLLAQKLNQSLPKLDVIICNAGYGGFTGIHWPTAIWTILTNFRQSVTYPTYKLSSVGLTTKPQISEVTDDHTGPLLGEVFCSNVFGHYFLVHGISNLFANSSSTHARIIWVGSLEAFQSTFSLSDLQGLSSTFAYESSKRLTDILALTAMLPSTQPYVRGFIPSQPNCLPPKQYITHPGICSTNIIALHWVLVYLVTAAFYVARWLGSPWHTVSAYKGACAPVWLALTAQEDLDASDSNDGPSKWGSGVDFWGKEQVLRTEVQGWGVNGKIQDDRDAHRRGRPQGVENLTQQAREQFEVEGAECWRQMESMREEWEEILKEKDE